MRSKQPIIYSKNLNKSFKLPHEQANGLKQTILNIFRRPSRRRRGYEIQHVLHDISFEINKGDFFGIVGKNGSGKSTLMKLLAGIYTPDSGQVHIGGSLTPFIELGVGFNPELTGRENVFLNGALLGFNRTQVEAMYDEIVSFAELEKFMDQKLKNYSSGMQVRLAFSIAIRAKSDILLVDEVLAVGDAAFQTKCFDYFSELKKSDTTVVFISHDKSSLERFCDKGILIDNGKIVSSGDMTKVLDAYSKVVLEELDHTEEEKKGKRTVSKTGHVEIAEAHFINSASEVSRKFSFGDKVSARINVKVKRDVTNPIFGITVWQRNLNEKPVYATNTLIAYNKKTGEFKKGETVVLQFDIPQSLNDGEYYLEPAVANESATVFYDRKIKAAKMNINGSNNPHSVVALRGEKIILTRQ